MRAHTQASTKFQNQQFVNNIFLIMRKPQFASIYSINKTVALISQITAYIFYSSI